MATSINSPNLSNAIRTDVPAINAILKALAKSDPSVLTDIENGTKRIVGENNRWSFQEYVDGSWITRKQFNIDATSVDGKTLSSDATANTIALRDSSGKLAGDITGNAATATKATALASTLAVAGGGTGATTAAAARTNLGVPPTSHASNGTSYGVSTASNYGHAKASATSPKALGTAAVGSETGTFARGDHVHPTTTATGSVLGMVKLSDSTTSTSAASAGIAASPKAVKAAMDKATSAATAASNAATAAATAQTTADSKLGSITAGTGIAVSGATVSLASGVVSAAKRGPTANATLSYGGTFSVPYIQYDAYGRVIAGATRTMTMPAAPSISSISGNAATATKLQTARSISVTIPKKPYDSYVASPRNIANNAAITGSASFDGSGNVTITLNANDMVTLDPCHCSSSCFIDGTFKTSRGNIHVSEIHEGDYIYSVDDVAYEVVHIMSAPVSPDKKVITYQGVKFTSDHVFKDPNGNIVAYDLDAVDKFRAVYKYGNKIGAYSNVICGDTKGLYICELSGDFIEYIPVVRTNEKNKDVWALFGSVPVQLAVEGE